VAAVAAAEPKRPEGKTEAKRWLGRLFDLVKEKQDKRSS